MKELTIISGKGGTGKTSVALALMALASDVVLCDNDVDASNLHVVANPQVLEEHVFEGGWISEIDEEMCVGCGTCMQYCRFGAISINSEAKFWVNNFQCEGCRLCERLCQVNAITSYQSRNNKWHISKTRFGTMVHASMGAGEDNSGKLVTVIRKQARDIAHKEKSRWLINDGPPGVGCSAIASLSGVDAAILVTEPSLSALHDAERVVELALNFKIPVYAIINKFDLNTEITQRLLDFFKRKSITVAGFIPFNEGMVTSMINRKAIVEYMPDSEIVFNIKDIWRTLTESIS